LGKTEKIKKKKKKNDFEIAEVSSKASSLAAIERKPLPSIINHQIVSNEDDVSFSKNDNFVLSTKSRTTSKLLTAVSEAESKVETK
jgi:hypothetical protein